MLLYFRKVRVTVLHTRLPVILKNQVFVILNLFQDLRSSGSNRQARGGSKEISGGSQVPTV
jgi:hypothetical protein